MNEQNPIKSSFFNKVKEVAINLWSKFKQTRFYTNKKIFFPIVIAFGLIFLTILLGLIFGGKKATAPRSTPTPTPFVSQNQPTASPSGDILSQMGQELSDIKTQINAFDVRQGRLQPQAIDFKTSF